jgi:hypothetical protein
MNENIRLTDTTLAFPKISSDNFYSLTIERCEQCETGCNECHLNCLECRGTCLNKCHCTKSV